MAGPAPANGWSVKSVDRTARDELAGIFAAGYVRPGSLKSCAAAVGEGGIAVESVQEVLRTGSAELSSIVSPFNAVTF
jgi:thioredoxin reductase (NADPH)